MTMATRETGNLNGMDADGLRALIRSVAEDDTRGSVKFGVRTQWKGGTISETSVDAFEMGGTRVPRKFAIRIDEPCELGGTNTCANPQEMLMAAMNACMMVGYVAMSTLHGVTLEHVEIETKGELDLRGFLGLDPSVKPGYDTLHYTVRIKGDGTDEQFRQIHEGVAATSPNRFNIAAPIRLTSDLVVL